MSIEYTIDIQLTELGFTADTIYEQDTSTGESPSGSTSSVDSASPSHRPITRSAKLKQKLLASGHRPDDGKDACAVRRTSSRKRSAGDSSSSVSAPSSNHVKDEPGGGPEHPLPEQPITDPDKEQDLIIDRRKARRKGATKKQQDEEDDSGDSDVSGVYDEDEEEEDEEELNSEMGQSGDYSCSVCGLQLPSKFKLQDHMNLHTGARPYGCAECGKRFCQISSYRVHLRTHAKTEVERFQCRVCCKIYPCQEDLKHHLSISHFQDKYYECDLCKRVFVSLEACALHIKERMCMRTIKCEICSRHFSTQKQLVRHKKKTCSRNFRCTDCGETFAKKNALLKHSFSHLGLLPYTCVRCRCHFRLAKLYIQHKCEPERIHCVACLREFPSPKDFEQHKKDTGCWGNQEPKGDEIRCLECGQMFDTSEELKKHAGAHQRVLKCAECRKGFRSALLLMSHMGGHAGNSPCLCQSCGLGFPHQQNYDSHLKTCGQTPQPKSWDKKGQASNSSSSRTATLMPKLPSANSTTLNTKLQLSYSEAPIPKPQSLLSILNAKPPSSNPTWSNGKPESSNPRGFQEERHQSNQIKTKPESTVSALSAPIQVPHNPGLKSEDASDPTAGMWKLTLNKPLPPHAELVLFLPVSATQPDSLALSSVLAPTPPASAVMVQPQVALPLVSNKPLGVGATPRAAPNAPLDLFTHLKQFPNYEEPFDLSKKRKKSESTLGDVPPFSVKSEPEESEISANRFEEQALKNNNSDTYPEVKRIKMDPLDLSTSSGLMIDIKKETF
ncbi:zinc finger protein 12 [Cheilinus undulatus]|uniref:zinc finger protein 12 n=1 Tax=Cheilinus undulatus TaxID=241271 RepID=UPI001BD3BC6C|nr:zinc finger protein 12 [Cheilinus undulatus]